jgi:putative SOS response-associated peptidase YedK
MPVILTKPEEIETWMTAPTDEALKLQRTFAGWSAEDCGAWVKEG